jgi:PAS domain S-box-containing protein
LLPFDIHYHVKTYTREFLPVVRVKKQDAGFQKRSDARADSGERQRVEEALRESEQRLQDILDNTTAVVFVKDLELRYILVNREYERRHRVQRDQIRGKTDFDIHPHDVAGTLRANDRHVIERGTPIQFEEAVPMTEGKRQYVVVKFLLRDRTANPYAVCGIATDITERKRAEEKLAGLNRTLQTLYQCDQALVRATEEYDLLRSVCGTLVEVGGLRMAWVGYREFNEDKTVRPVAHAGYEAGYLERINVTWGDTDRGRGPVGTAIRTGTTSWNRGILSDPNMAPWRTEALRRRYGCCISLPLMSQGKAFGALALYAEELDAFNESAIQQYTDLANNLAYGVMALRTREERNRAESEIRQLNASLERRVAERTIELVRSNEQLKRAEEQLRKHGEQMQIHRDVLLELARSDKSDLEKALQKICSLSAATLEVARVSYWSLQENNSVIACEVLYLRTAESCDEQFKGTRLVFSGCPAYFEALATRRPIVADRVLRHPATRGLAEDYLKPLGISSMLDAPVWVSGKVVGVLCHEHTGPSRDWSAEEIDFVSALASMVSLALEESNRARSEHLLRESEEKFRALFEGTSQAVVLHDENGILEVNPSWLQLLGYSRLEDVIGKHLAEVSAPIQVGGESAEALARKHITNALANGSTRFEWRVLRRDSTEIPIEVFLTPVQLGGRQLFQAVCNDITVRKRAEEELRQSEARLRESEARFSTAFRASPLLVTISRLSDAKFVEANDAFVRWFGLSHDRIVGHDSNELSIWLNPDDRAKFLTDLQRNGSLSEVECQVRSQRGSVHTILLSADIIEINREPHMLVSGLDITQRKQAEAELLRTLAREKELGQLRSKFVSMVSHEFRTPLAIIQSSAEILNDYLGQLENGERKDHLRSIRKNTRRMAALMEETLLIGSIDAGKMEFKPTLLELRTFVQRLVDEVLSATNRRCPIKFSLAETPAKVRADGRLLRHIFTNLLQNAVKYSDVGRLVQFDIECTGADIVCTIRDQGIGILKADQEWLFSAFHRGRNVGDRPGTGLGLVIVKRCVDLHGGTIEVDSKLGEGTSVTLRLPMLSPESTASRAVHFEVDHAGKNSAGRAP